MSGTLVDPVDGLRARKRAATAATIERAALELAVEHGYENVTVDMICAASSVSPRTFFNYFGSKEGAVLGPIAPEPSDQERAAFLQASGTDVLTDLVVMLASAMTDQGRDRGLHAARRAVVTATPGLLTKQVDRMGEQESKLVELVLHRFAQQGRTACRPDGLEEEARMVVTLMGAVMRFSARHWFEGKDAFEVIPMLERNLALARQVVLSGS